MSEIELVILVMNFALLTKLFLAASHISFLKNFIIKGTFYLLLFMVSTEAALSKFTMILFLHHKGPQRPVVMMIGYTFSSKNTI